MAPHDFVKREMATLKDKILAQMTPFMDILTDYSCIYIALKQRSLTVRISGLERDWGPYTSTDPILRFKLTLTIKWGAALQSLSQQAFSSNVILTVALLNLKFHIPNTGPH